MVIGANLDKGFRGIPFVKYVDESDEEENEVEDNDTHNGGDNEDPHDQESVGGEAGGGHSPPNSQQQSSSNSGGGESSHSTSTGAGGEASDSLSCKTIAGTLAEVGRPRGNYHPGKGASGTIAYPDVILTPLGSWVVADAQAMLGTAEDSSPKVSKNTVHSQRSLQGRYVDGLKHNTCFNGDSQRGGFEHSNAVRPISVRRETTRTSGLHKAQGVLEAGASDTHHSTIPRTRATQLAPHRARRL